MKQIAMITAMLFVAVTAAHSQSQTLQFNRSGERMNGRPVVVLQKHLLYHGYDLGGFGVDGWFGPVTEAALIAYQRDRGMEATGRISLSALEPSLPWYPTMARLERTATLPEIGTQQEIVCADRTVVDTYYGELRIQEATLQDGFIFQIDTAGAPIELGRTTSETILNSNSGRFFAYEFPDYAEEDGRESHIAIIDLLTEQTHRIYAAELAAVDLDTPFQEFYWTRSEQLLIRLFPPGGSFLITVKEKTIAGQ